MTSGRISHKNFAVNEKIIYKKICVKCKKKWDSDGKKVQDEKCNSNSDCF